MNHVRQLIALVGPSTATPDIGVAQRRLLAAAAMLGALPLAALWGVAAGSAPGTIAIRNLVAVPMLLVTAILVSLPIGLLALRLMSEKARPTELLLAHSGGIFVGALVLALLAPLVALYQFSSAWVGPTIAVASAALAVIAGLLIVFRVLQKLLPDRDTLRELALPLLLLMGLECVAFAQVASVTDPIFAQRTTLGRGVDAIQVHNGVR